MAHSSCTWCDVSKDLLHERGELRTIGSCINNHQAWAASGSKPNNTKNYKCCVHPPIFSGNSDTKILTILPPPELHLLLGVVNTLVDKMSRELEEITNDWIKDCNVKREVTNGGTGFNGNSCRILLKKVDILREKNLRCLKYVDTLKKFNDVVESCFGIKLKTDYLEKISIFKKSYLSLQISVTPKVHAVFYHIEDYCSEHKKGLGVDSEQAMESVHHDFKTTWKHYLVDVKNENYDHNLLRAVCAYNGKHI